MTQAEVDAKFRYAIILQDQAAIASANARAKYQDACNAKAELDSLNASDKGVSHE